MAVLEKTTFSFPEIFDIDTGKTKMISGLKATNSNIGLLLRTSVYEMFGDPAIGSRLVEYLFSPNMDLIRDMIVDHLKLVLENFQTDIEVTYVNLEYYEGEEETIHIKIDYMDKSTGQYYQSISLVDLSEIKPKGGY